MPDRLVRRVIQSQPTIEGAGVRLNRAFGFDEVPQFDPFLLLDDFRSGEPADYLRGFPSHPHRGMETITYVLQGFVEHSDSMGNRGVIGPGDVQWMTAGSGIIHQEMPKGDADGWMGGFQLWANLPASHKMTAPRYREVKSAEIPEVRTDTGAVVRVICGEVQGARGPVRDIVTDPEYLDVFVPAASRFTHASRPGNTVFAYVIEGEGRFGSAGGPLQGNRDLLLFSDGDRLTAVAEDKPVRFLLVSGRPLREQIAWRGPIVMNTQEELRKTFDELRNGTFVKFPVKAP
jgi:quercetin 2,3-dioxygenase